MSEMQPHEPRRPGRPRKWANDAERAKAYRQRRAAELSDAEALRQELRSLRRRVATLEAQKARLERAVASSERRQVAAEEALHVERAELERERQRVARLEGQLAAPAQRPTTSALPAAPAGDAEQLSRQQRRALERLKRKQNPSR